MRLAGTRSSLECEEIKFTLIKFLYILEKDLPVNHGHVDGVCNKSSSLCCLQTSLSGLFNLISQMIMVTLLKLITQYFFFEIRGLSLTVLHFLDLNT